MPDVSLENYFAITPFFLIIVLLVDAEPETRVQVALTHEHPPWQVGGAASICSRSPRRHVRISLPTSEKPGWHLYLMMSPAGRRAEPSDVDVVKALADIFTCVLWATFIFLYKFLSCRWATLRLTLRRVATFGSCVFLAPSTDCSQLQSYLCVLAWAGQSKCNFIRVYGGGLKVGFQDERAEKPGSGVSTWMFSREKDLTDGLKRILSNG